METFSASKLQAFLEHVLRYDIQILVNRRQARAIFNDSLAAGPEAADPFDYPVEKSEKIAAFLELHDTSSKEAATSVYAFVRLVGDMRRELRRHNESAAPSTASGSPSRASTHAGN